MKTVTSKQSNFIPVAIIGALFFIFGFITWLNGILIPYLKIACELTNFESTFVAFAFYISYTLMALPSSWLLRKTGFKRGMSWGLITMAIGTTVFIPAALSRDYHIFLVGLFIIGTGLAILQTASNPYITILGPKETAARRISLMGIFNKLAGAAAPLILAYFILSDGDQLTETLKTLEGAARTAQLDQLAHRVILPYGVMTATLLLLAAGIRLSPLPELEEQQDEENEHKEEMKKSILAFPQLILGAITLFFYVGAEVIAGDTIIRYGQSLNISIEIAKSFTSYTLIAMVVGYIAGIILIPKVLTQRAALLGSAILGLAFTLGAIRTEGMVSVSFIAALGLANALVWPAIWPLALDGLGRFIKTGSALLIMAIAGGALLPLVWGKLSDIYSARQAYWVLVPCYLIILYYAQRGYKLRKW